MARRRTIDPAFWQSITVSKLSLEQRLFLLGIFSNADDEGFLRAESPYLKAVIFPYDPISTQKIDEWVEVIRKGQFVKVHRVKGQKIIEIPKWRQYQFVDRPRDSQLRMMVYNRSGRQNDSSNDSTNDQRGVDPGSPSCLDKSSRSQDQLKPSTGVGRSGGKGTFDFGHFCSRYFRFAGIHPTDSPKLGLPAAYDLACSRHGEDTVLSLIEPWVESRGKESVKKGRGLAAKDFLRDVETMAAGLVIPGRNEQEDEVTEGQREYGRKVEEAAEKERLRRAAEYDAKHKDD